MPVYKNIRKALLVQVKGHQVQLYIHTHTLTEATYKQERKTHFSPAIGPPQLLFRDRLQSYNTFRGLGPIGATYFRVDMHRLHG